MKKQGTILIIDDEEDILLSLRLLLKQHYSSVFTERNPYHLPRLLRQYKPEVLLLDMNFSKGSTSGEEGLRWLQKAKELNPQLQVVIITAHSDVPTAVKALKLGALDFVEKPWRNEKLVATIQSAFELGQSQQKIESLEHQQEAMNVALDQPFQDIIGQSDAMQSVYKTIQKVAVTDADVLILGENGTGKELIARALHRQSKRNKKVFMPVDLGAIPDNLFESELFGHKKGAFTDAKEDRMGRFQAAHHGTLFLDEIGNLSLPAQAKLLRALQDRKVTPVGSHQSISVDIRLICATNISLTEAVDEKMFRQDLLYRINTVEIHLPPLRERFGDIPILSEHFLKIYGKKYQKPKIKLAKSAKDKLSGYHWPGNIRELRHAIERAVILGDEEELQAEDFFFQKKEGNIGMNLDDLNLENMERQLIDQAMKKNQGNITKAAKELGLTRAALYRRIEKFGI